MAELPTPSLPEAQPQTALQNVPAPAHTSEMHASSVTPHHGKRILFIAGAAIVGVSAVAGLAYASWAGYLPNPFVERPNAVNLLASLESLQSAQTSTTIHVALEQQESDVTPLDFSLFQSKKDGETNPPSFTLLNFVEMLPSDLKLDLNVNTAFSKTSNASANEETHITGTYTGNNISASLDLTTRTINEITYIKPDAIPLPIPLFDMSALEGTWINISNKGEDRNVFEETSHNGLNEEREGEKKPNTLLELFTLLKQGVEDGAIIFSVPERITYNNERVWKTDAVIDGEKLRDTVISIGQNRDTLFPNEKYFALFTDDVITATQKERAKEIYRELFARTTLSSLMNNDNAPLSLSFSTRIAPKLKDTTLEGRQITLETTVVFANLNEAITVQVPEETLSIQEAGALLLGQSKESIIANAQRNTITDLQSALSLYLMQYDEYPESLEDLLGTEDETRKVVNIPEDAITKKPYIYAQTETGYTLRYEMPKTNEDDFSLFDTVIEGTNTATEHFSSEEAAKLSDTDEDGLSEYDEIIIYGTSDYATDTDNDGYDDKTEIDGGYNPHGDGLWEGAQ